MSKTGDYLIGCADRLAFEIWDNGIASKEAAEILSYYIFFEQGEEVAAVLTAKEITTANVDEYVRAMCGAVITYAHEVLAESYDIIDRAKETLYEIDE